VVSSANIREKQIIPFGRAASKTGTFFTGHLFLWKDVIHFIENGINVAREYKRMKQAHPPFL